MVCSRAQAQKTNQVLKERVKLSKDITFDLVNMNRKITLRRKLVYKVCKMFNLVVLLKFTLEN